MLSWTAEVQRADVQQLMPMDSVYNRAAALSLIHSHIN